MWKQKIGISIGTKKNTMPYDELFTMVKKTGFDAVSPSWLPDIDIESIINTARECGLEVEAVHGPYRGAAALWSRDESLSTPPKEELIKALEDCARCKVAIMVTHVWIGFGDNGYDENNLYFDNYDEIVATAERLGVKLALENTEGEEYLGALMERYKDNLWVGYCWDSGHEMCYNHSNDLLGKYGDQLILTHINDNLGISRYDGETYWTDDIHLLPYDGIADWDKNVERLRASKRVEILNFEVNRASKGGRHDNDLYNAMPREVFFAEAYKRACRIAYKYSM